MTLEELCSVVDHQYKREDINPKEWDWYQMEVHCSCEWADMVNRDTPIKKLTDAMEDHKKDCPVSNFHFGMC